MSERTACGDSGGTNAAGEPCRAVLGLSETNGLCIVHDPEREERAREVRSAGGRAGVQARAARARPELPEGMPRSEPKTLEDAVRWSAWAIHATAAGVIDARTGHEIGYLVNAFKAAVEKRDLQREIESIRDELDQLKKRRPA